MWRDPDAPPASGGLDLVRRFPWLRAFLAVGAVLLAAATHRLAGETGNMAHPVAAPLAYALSIGLALLATRPAGGEPPAPDDPPWTCRETAFLAVLTVAALLLRVVAIDRIPPALSGDEASTGFAALAILEGRFDSPFVVSWFSFPSFFFFIPAASIAVFGASFEALRIPSAIAGAATVAGLYLLARALWGRRTAVFASALLTTLHLHVHFSRTGLNNVWDGLLAVATLGLFWRGWVSGRRSLFVGAGFALGASQYFYASGRLLPILLVSWLVLLVLFERRLPRGQLSNLAAMGLMALVVFLPLGLFFFRNPDEYAAPMNRVKVLGPWLEHTASRMGLPEWRVLAGNFADAATGFSVRPLRSWYRPGAPMLLPPAAFLFHAGLLLALFRIRDPRPRLVLLWLAGVVAIGGLTESAPASQRFVVGAPAAVLLAAWALASATEAAERLRPGLRPALFSAAALVLAGSAVLDIDRYFRRYVHSRDAIDANTEIAMTLAARLAGEPPGTRVYFLGPPRMGFASIPTLPFLAPHVAAVNVDAPLQAPPAWSVQNVPLLAVALPERAAELQLVREALGSGRIEYGRGRAGQLLYLAWVVPAGPVR